MALRIKTINAVYISLLCKEDAAKQYSFDLSMIDACPELGGNEAKPRC